MKSATEVKRIPSRPVVAGGIAGAIAGSVTVILVWGLGMSDVIVPPEVASAFTTLFTTLIGAIAAHVTRD